MEGLPKPELPRKTADQLVEEARSLIEPRLSPAQAYEGMELGQVVLVDIRPYEQQVKDGLIPGAVLVDANVFEFRCDPAQPDEYRDPNVKPLDYSQLLVVVCNEGFQSSLKAANLRRIGLYMATDLDGGMKAWVADGLPVVPHPDRP